MSLILISFHRVLRSLIPGVVLPENACYIHSGFLSLHKNDNPSCMNIREQQIIRGLRSSNERERGDLISELFFGKGGGTNDLKEILQRVVKICYGGAKYAGCYRQIYETLVEMVCLDIWKAADSTIEGIKELKGYFFQVTRNCANSNRKTIEGLLGINGQDRPINPERPLPSEPEEPEDEDGSELFVFLFFGGNDVELDGRTREDLARELVKRYIGQISRENYRKVLYAIDIWGWSHERIERELDIHNIDQNHRRARLALTRVALPDIRKTCYGYFDRHRDSLSSGEADLLDRFFHAGGGPTDDVAKAYMKLVKVVKREKAEFSKEMRRAVREEKGTLKAAKKNNIQVKTINCK